MKPTLQLTPDQAEELHEDEQLNIIHQGQLITIHSVEPEDMIEAWVDGEKATILNNHKKDPIVTYLPLSKEATTELLTGSPF